MLSLGAFGENNKKICLNKGKKFMIDFTLTLDFTQMK